VVRRDTMTVVCGNGPADRPSAGGGRLRRPARGVQERPEVGEHPWANGMTIRDRIKDFRRVPASSLRPAPANWRTHSPAQRDALNGLLSEIGFAGATLVRELPDGSLEIIDGHLRAEEMGDRDVPVLVTDLDAEEARKLLATFDPLGAMAEADPAKLDALLQEVGTADGAVAALLSQLADAAGTKDVRMDGSLGEVAGACEYPLTPVPGEKYDYVLVFCDNESDYANLQTVLKIAPRSDYKSKAVAAGRVIRFREFQRAIEEWARHGDYGGDPVGRPGRPGAGGEGDHG
jgi:ParB-like nuclease family protein